MKSQKKESSSRSPADFSKRFRKGFLEGLGAQANLIMPFSTAPTRPVPVYKSKGLAGDWEKVGGDIGAAMESHTPRK